MNGIMLKDDEALKGEIFLYFFIISHLTSHISLQNQQFSNLIANENCIDHIIITIDRIYYLYRSKNNIGINVKLESVFDNILYLKNL